MGLRVAHVGTGTTGGEALRAIILDPELDLVGLWVTTPQKAGLDAGALCGLPDTGVKGTLDLDEILAMDLDCFSFGGNAIGHELDSIKTMSRFLERGINVVTFAVVSLVYPPASPPELRDVVIDACERGRSTFFASGIEPGWASFSVPYTLLSVAGQVTRYREEQHVLDMAEVYPIPEVVFGSMGFGQPMGSVPPRFVDGVCAKWWVPNLNLVADALGVEIESTNFVWEAHPTREALDTSIGRVEAGTIGATYWRLQGLVKGEPMIAVHYVSRVAREAAVPDHWPRPAPDTQDGAIAFVIEGRPQFRVQIYTERQPGETTNSSLAMTALHTINAIPSVVAARPGQVTPLDLPMYTTRLTRNPIGD